MWTIWQPWTLKSADFQPQACTDCLLSSSRGLASLLKTMNSDMDQDAKIMAQRDAIDEEIKRTVPLVSEKLDISCVEHEFQNDLVYLEKVQHLKQKFGCIRRTRPDGNCFFRAVGYAYFERLRQDPAEWLRFKNHILPSKDKMVKLGFPSFTVEDFYDNFIDVLEKLQPSNSEAAMSADELHCVFNDQGASDYLVVYLRLLTSMQIQDAADFYQNFMECGQSVVEFCKLEVEPFFKESDHIHVTALTQATGIPVQIMYLDRGNNKHASEHNFPQDRADQAPLVNLLYRPGHYDILYPKCV